MRFSGYETIDSIPKLRSKEEQGKMFEFVKSVSEIIENKDEMFWLFKANPQKVMMLPGLQVLSVVITYNAVLFSFEKLFAKCISFIFIISWVFIADYLAPHTKWNNHKETVSPCSSFFPANLYK